MKKLLTLIALAVLVTACGAEATPTAEGGAPLQPGQQLVCTVK